VSSRAPRDSCAIIALVLVLVLFLKLIFVLKLIFGLLVLLREGALLFKSFFLSFFRMSRIGRGDYCGGEEEGESL